MSYGLAVFFAVLAPWTVAVVFYTGSGLGLGTEVGVWLCEGVCEREEAFGLASPH